MNAALPAVVSWSPVKNSQKANPPPMIPIERREVHEAFLNFFFCVFEK